MARREPRWVKLFLRELERTGNVRLAAERAGVDFSTAYQRRKAHAEFAERWAVHLAVSSNRLAAFGDGSGQALRSFDDAQESLRSGQAGAVKGHAVQQSLTSFRQAQDEREGVELAPPPSLGRSPSPGNPGEEMVVRPDGKVIKGSEARWGKRAEERFLAELTVSANIRHAAKAAGFSTTAVYQRRLKDRHFAAAWDAAVETGKARVQAYLVEAATRTFDPDELPIGDERELPKVSIGEAINIARLKACGPANPAEDSWDYGESNIEEVRERILEKLQRLRERNEAEERESGRCRSCGQSLPADRLPDDAGWQDLPVDD